MYNGTAPLPFSQPYLKEIIDCKEKKKEKVKKYIVSEKNNLF